MHYAKACREAGILTSLDGGGLRSNTHELLEFVDVAVVAERLCEQMDLSPAGMLDYLQSRGCRIGGGPPREKGPPWEGQEGTRGGFLAPLLARPGVVDNQRGGRNFHGGLIRAE